MRGYACRGPTTSIRRRGCDSRRLHFSPRRRRGEKCPEVPKEPRDYNTADRPNESCSDAVLPQFVGQPYTLALVQEGKGVFVLKTPDGTMKPGMAQPFPVSEDQWERARPIRAYFYLTEVKK